MSITYPETLVIAPVEAPSLTVVVPCYNERANVPKLVARLARALDGLDWEAVFVDDNSPDGTADAVRAIAQHDRRVRCIRRIGRRGLASAVIEGALSSSADYIAVMDGDLQHDERRLPDLLGRVRSGEADVAVASRYTESDTAAGLSDAWRQRISTGGIRMVQFLLPAPLRDPMSGYFVLKRSTFEAVAPHLTGQGFKILLDLLLSAPTPLRVAEVQTEFFSREEGSSKLDVLVMVQFLGLVLEKTLHGLLPLRFIAFAAVGGTGIFVNLAVSVLCWSAGFGFEAAQIVGTVVAMVANFFLNNAITYRDRRLRGWDELRGLAVFMAVCGIGAVANVGIAQMFYASTHASWTAAGTMGAAIGVVWNYAVSSTLVWRAR